MSRPTPDPADARRPTGRPRAMQRRIRAALCAPSGASGCSGWPRWCCRRRSSPSCSATMLRQGVERLHRDRDRAADRLRRGRGCRSTPTRLRGPRRRSRAGRRRAGGRGRRRRDRGVRQAGGAELLSDGAWLRVRDAMKRRSVAARAPRDDRGARRRPRSTSPPRATARPTAEATVARLTARGRCRRGFNRAFLTGADSTDPTRVGIWGALKGSLLTMVVTLAARLPDRRARRALPRGICAAEPLDRPDRGVDQQSRRGAVDHLRAARPRGVPRHVRPAALGAAGRRADAGADDDAGDRHRRAQRDQGGAAVDPRRRARRSARRRCRSCSTTSCRSRCPAS